MGVDTRILDKVEEHAYEGPSRMERFLSEQRELGYRLVTITPVPGMTGYVHETGEMVRTGPIFVCLFEPWERRR